MSRQVSPSAKRSYGVLQVTRVWGAARATLYRHRRCDEPGAGRRPGPVGPMPDEALVEAIRKLLADSPFHGEGYRKIWARLRFAGIRTSKQRVLRLTREHGLQAPGRVGRPHGPKAHDGTIRTERVDEMWGTDLTSTMTGEGQASIFVTVDHASTECVGIHAARRATRFEALEPLRQSVRTCFGAFAEGIASGLKLRHDHGSQFVADDFQREVAFLGIASSPAFVREPEGNGCVERFIRTLKENLLWVRRFATIEDLRLALHAFKDTYNRTWIVERHAYQTPAAVRAAQLAPLDDPFEFARLQAFNSYLCATVHVAHAHRMRGHRWVDDDAAIAAMQRKVPQSVGDCFALIEETMFAGPWVMGATYGIADPYLFTLGQWLAGDGVDIERYPKIADHHRRMRARPAVERAIAAERA